MLTVYTVIIGRYDTLIEPEVAPYGVHFVCFTDQPFVSAVWEMMPITDVPAHADTSTRISRWFKMHPHLYFEGPTLYIDGSVRITGDCRQDDDLGFTLCSHPTKTNIYNEAKAAGIRGGGTDVAWCARQALGFESLGMPESAKLYAGTVLYRPDSHEMRMFNEAWWRLYRLGSTRDQLPLNFLIWLLNFPVNEFCGSLFKSNFHIWRCKHLHEMD